MEIDNSIFDIGTWQQLILAVSFVLFYILLLLAMSKLDA